MEPVRLGGGDEGVDGGRIDRLGAGQRERERRQVEALRPPQRPRRQHPGEVGTGGRRAAQVRDPLHPVAGMGHEVLRRRLHEVDARSSSGGPGSRRGPCRGTAAATTPSPRRRRAARPQRSVDVRRRAPGRGSSRPSARSSSRSCTAGSPAARGPAGHLEGVAVRHARARRAARRDIDSVGGSPAPDRRRRRTGRRSAAAWRRRGGCGRAWTARTPRASPSASATAAPSTPARPASSRARS